MDAEAIRGFGRLGGNFPGNAELTDRPEGAGLLRRASASDPRRKGTQETGARNRRYRTNRALLFSSVGHSDRGHLFARVRGSEGAPGNEESVGMVNDQGNSFPWRLAV